MAQVNSRVRIRETEFGYCNICEKYGKLTDDHIPPKGSAKIGPVEIRTLSDHFSGQKTFFHISQKGLIVTSICAVCNNYRLGKLYDPYLNKISHEIKALVRAFHERRLIWPDKLKITITPQRVARAVVGHLLAGNLSADKDNTPIKTPMLDGLRNYFLDASSPCPQHLEIYYWLYLGNDQKILKNVAIAIPGEQNLLFGELLKFFPLAYWVVWKKPNELQINLPKLIERKTVALDDTAEIDIDFRNIPRIDWPENPDNNMIILYCDDTTKVAIPKRQRKRRSI